MTKAALLSAALVVASFSFVACGGGVTTPKPPSRLTTRVLASQSVSSPTAFPALVIVDGYNDTLPRASEISAGSSPGLMALSPDRATVLAFDSVSNSVEVVNTQKETLTGSVQLAGPTTSMVALATGSGYAAVPATPFASGPPPGAVVVMNLSAGSITATLSVPSAQTVVSSPDGTHLLVFSNDSDVVTIIYPPLVNVSSPVSATVPGFDRPVYGVFSADGSKAYILNCGPECGSGTRQRQRADSGHDNLNPGRSSGCRRRRNHRLAERFNPLRGRYFPYQEFVHRPDDCCQDLWTTRHY